MTGKDPEYEYSGSQVKKKNFKEKQGIVVSNVSDESSVVTKSWSMDLVM